MLALTGVTHKEFGALPEAFCLAYATAYPGDQTPAGRTRKRRSGGGRKGQLGTTEQQRVLSLVYLTTSPRQALVGAMFGQSQARANRWVPRVLPSVQQALEDLGGLPSREPEQGAEQEGDHQEAAARSIDGTERRRQRPKNPAKQAWHDRGKQKTQRDKNVVVVNAKTTRVGYVSQT